MTKKQTCNKIFLCNTTSWQGRRKRHAIESEWRHQAFVTSSTCKIKKDFCFDHVTCPFTTSTTNEAGCHHVRSGKGMSRSDVVGGERYQMVRGHFVEVVVVAEAEVVEVVGGVVVVEATMVVPGTHAHWGREQEKIEKRKKGSRDISCREGSTVLAKWQQQNLHRKRQWGADTFSSLFILDVAT